MNPVQRRARIAELQKELAELQDQEAEEAIANANTDLVSRVLALVDANLSVKACLLYRSEKNSTLVEAKAAVDKMINNRSQQLIC